MGVYKKWFRSEPQFADSADTNHRKSVLDRMHQRKELWQYAPQVYDELKEKLSGLPNVVVNETDQRIFEAIQGTDTLFHAVLSTRDVDLRYGQVIELWVEVTPSEESDITSTQLYDIVNETLVYGSPEHLLESEGQARLPYHGW